MKKGLYFIFILCSMISLLGCSNKDEEENIDITGLYFYNECIYVNPLSSSTPENQTNLYKHMRNFEFGDSSLSYTDINDGLLEQYSNIEYVLVDVNTNIDSVFNLGINDFLETIDTRYDILNNNEWIHFFILIKGQKVYIAESNTIGENNDIYVIWSVFEITKATIY